MSNVWLVVSGISGSLGVMLGAFGAHTLRIWLPLQKVTIFETGVRYHLIHTLALFATSILLTRFPAGEQGLRRVAALFLAGIVLFSGGLYGTALTDFAGFRWLPPLGGISWIIAWASLAWICARVKPDTH